MFALDIFHAVIDADGIFRNAYPSYSKLNYSLSDQFTTDTFFDNFDYYTDADPTDGFVIFVDSTEASSLVSTPMQVSIQAF